MDNSFTKKTIKGCPLSSLQHAVKRKRKMALESYHCESSEVYCTIEDFLILKELQSPFTNELQVRSWTKTRTCQGKTWRMATLT